VEEKSAKKHVWQALVDSFQRRRQGDWSLDFAADLNTADCSWGGFKPGCDPDNVGETMLKLDQKTLRYKSSSITTSSHSKQALF